MLARAQVVARLAAIGICLPWPWRPSDSEVKHEHNAEDLPLRPYDRDRLPPLLHRLNPHGEAETATCNTKLGV